MHGMMDAWYMREGGERSKPTLLSPSLSNCIFTMGLNQFVKAEGSSPTLALQVQTSKRNSEARCALALHPNELFYVCRPLRPCSRRTTAKA
jgi:hypothetical protein